MKALNSSSFLGNHFWPSIAFEFGYVESEEDLKKDVKILLESSEGAISRVTIMKLKPVGRIDMKIQKGFVEI